MRAFFRKDEQIRGAATWLRTWRPHVRVVPGAPVDGSGFGHLGRGRFFFLHVNAAKCVSGQTTGPSPQ